MKPKLGVWMYGVVLIGILVVSILLTTISLATTVEEGQLDFCNSSEIHTNTTYVQSAEFVLKDSYKQGEEIEIKIINNAKEAIYYDASGCIGGLCPFSYNIIQKESGDKIKNYNLCLPVPTLFRIEKIEPGKIKVIDIWDQNTYYITNPEKRECEAMQVSPGKYIINFSYSTDPELKNKFSTIKEITICICEEETNDTTVTTSQEENETSPTIGVGVLEIEVTRDGVTHEVIINRDVANEMLTFISNNISATTEEILKIEKDSVHLQTEKWEREIKILPDMASEIAKEAGISSIESIELKSVREEPTYVVKGVKEGKLVAVIPVSVCIETEINADTGAMEAIKKLWWEVLVF